MTHIRRTLRVNCALRWPEEGGVNKKQIETFAALTLIRFAASSWSEIGFSLGHKLIRFL